MKDEELLHELESLVEAFEQTFSVIAGLVAEQTDIKKAFMYVHAAEGAMLSQFGPNEWRDRLLRKVIATCAIKARRVSAGDPELQAMIERTLTPRTDDAPGSH